MYLRINSEVSPAHFGGPDVHELSVTVNEGSYIHRLTKTYPLEFFQSHFDVVWKCMGEELMSAFKKGGESE